MIFFLNVANKVTLSSFEHFIQWGGTYLLHYKLYMIGAFVDLEVDIYSIIKDRANNPN